MIKEGTAAYEKGRAAGFKFGMFNRKNPYDPVRMTEKFEEWEAGFTKGCQDKEWL